jgi:transcriptional regulator GlxA family with amidase domain
MKPPKTISQHSLERLQAVKTYIGQHYHEEMRLAHLAAIQGISPEAFSRLFSRQTGQCVSRHIIQVRIEHCQQLLRDTDMSVSDIAFSCGFNTLSFFNRSFLRQCNCTPTEYREKARRER